jgi:hypothetical protein
MPRQTFFKRQHLADVQVGFFEVEKRITPSQQRPPKPVDLNVSPDNVQMLKIIGFEV